MLWKKKRIQSTIPNYCIRFSYRKCLTHYMNAVFEENKFYNHRRKHFVRHLEQQQKERFISINNTLFWPDRKIFDNARMVHLIRHPKDIVISGYFYHKKGAEKWNREPMHRLWLYYLAFELDHIYNDQEKAMLNGETSLQEFLNFLPFEKGLMTEVVWLKYIHTFNPIPYYQSPKIKTFRFEEIVENPMEYVGHICKYWLLSEEETDYYQQRAAYYDQKPNYEIRDRSAFQYLQYFDASLNQFFELHFPGVAKRLDYPA